MEVSWQDGERGMGWVGVGLGQVGAPEGSAGCEVEACLCWCTHKVWLSAHQHSGVLPRAHVCAHPDADSPERRAQHAWQ